MNIARQIQGSIYASVGIPTYYGTREQINEIIGNGKLPCAFFTLLSDGTITEQAGRVTETFTLSVVFAESTEYDYGAYENEDIIDLCKERALRWLGYLRSGDVDFVAGEVTRSGRVYEQFDDVLTGYYISINITTLPKCY